MRTKTCVAGLAVMGFLLLAGPTWAQVEKASRLTDEEVVALITRARTPAEHATLATYYDQIAWNFEERAIAHRKLASMYRHHTVPIFPKIPTPISYASYYDGLAARAWRAATEASVMAEYHRMLAKAIADR